MTGLNMETFLRLARADWGIWISLGLILGLIAVMVWTNWGSKRILQRCLIASLVLHAVVVFHGGRMPIARLAMGEAAKPQRASSIQRIRLEGSSSSLGQSHGGQGGTAARALADWDRPTDVARPIDELKPRRPDQEAPAATELAREVLAAAEVPEPDRARLEINPPPPPGPEIRPTTDPANGSEAQVGAAPALTSATPIDPSEVADLAVTRPKGSDSPAVAPGDRRLQSRPVPKDAMPSTRSQLSRSAPSPLALPSAPTSSTGDLIASQAPEDRPDPSANVGVGPSGGSSPEVAKDPNLATEGIARSIPRSSTNGRSNSPGTSKELADATAGMPGSNRFRRPMASGPNARVSVEAPTLALADRGSAATLPRPNLGAAAGIGPGSDLTEPEARDLTGGRTLDEVPQVYRSRLEPNRSDRAQQLGATAGSEQAVERALDWLARHQDADGRWDAGAYKSPDGTVVPGQDDHTIHCPPGEICHGTCAYWEADTALTGLSLLAFLGAGHTQIDGGKHAKTVARGLEFLLASQKPDGDLRGDSKAVGMYCHSMAALALCEAYALTGDARLRRPVERAVNFLVLAQAPGGMGWRYSPRERLGDTSVLGWVVMVLKSAREVGIPISEPVRAGTLAWLDRVAAGPARGLARYQPGKEVTPSMTAEAWVCRQFLGTGGPSAASTEAADHLLRNGPDRGPVNLYYWYYGTLAMFQHGGGAWTRWNASVRDRLVQTQRLTGHQAGSWDPNTEGAYDRYGGRIYCTALGTLTLEVYYRFLRLYDAPSEERSGGVPAGRPEPSTVPNLARPMPGGARRGG